jgi:AcrR family transcriptional regulator
LIESSFKELVMAKPFDKITIADICERAHISRKTFYSYFIDKNDLIEHIIHDDVLKPIDDLRALLPTKNYKSAPKLLVEKLYQSIYEQRGFFERLTAHEEQHVLVNILVKEIAEMNRRILASTRLPAVEQEYMAYFYASAQAMLVGKWIRDKWRIAPNQLASFYYKWARQFGTVSVGLSPTGPEKPPPPTPDCVRVDKRDVFVNIWGSYVSRCRRYLRRRLWLLSTTSCVARVSHVRFRVKHGMTKEGTDDGEGYRRRRV